MVEKLDKFDRIIELLQRIIGGGLFVFMYVNDRGVDIGALSTSQQIFMGVQYAIALALLKAFTADEIIRVIEAVRGKRS